MIRGPETTWVIWWDPASGQFSDSNDEWSKARSQLRQEILKIVLSDTLYRRLKDLMSWVEEEAINSAIHKVDDWYREMFMSISWMNHDSLGRRYVSRDIHSVLLKRIIHQSPDRIVIVFLLFDIISIWFVQFFTFHISIFVYSVVSCMCLQLCITVTLEWL